MVYHLREVKKEETEQIQDLFDAVYPDNHFFNEYWDWMFECPYPYIPCGLYHEDKLVAFYSAIIHWNYGHTYSSMTHPEYRHRGLYQDVANYLYTELQYRHKCNYATFYSNKAIHNTHLKMGALDVFQIKEYRVSIDDLKKEGRLHQGANYYPMKYEPDSLNEWRYLKHPIKKYIYYKNFITRDYIVMSEYENRIQIIECSNIEKVIGLGGFIGKVMNKDTVSFWSEKDLDYPSVLIDEWLMVKNFNLKVLKYGESALFKTDKLIKQLKKQKLYMGISDVY